MKPPVLLRQAARKIARALRRPDFRVFTLLLLLAAASSLQAQGTPQALATAVGSQAKPWIFWTIRIVAGGMSGGGLYSLITAFTGNDEGFSKAAKVFGGLILMGIGIYCLSTPQTVYDTLNLGNMFSTT